MLSFLCVLNVPGIQYCGRGKNPDQDIQNYKQFQFRSCKGSRVTTIHKIPAPMATQIHLDTSLAVGYLSLSDDVGKRYMIVQKDDKTLVGKLATVDHYGNVILQNAVERLIIKTNSGYLYGDIRIGCILVRSDSIVLACEMDPTLEEQQFYSMKKVAPEDILAYQKAETDAKDAKEAALIQGMKTRGIFCRSKPSLFDE